MPPDNPGPLNARIALRGWCLLALLLCATAALLSFPHKSEAVSNQGLVGYWSFNEGTGTVATDFSGNGNTGTFSGSPLPTWVSGKRGSALRFPGVGSEGYVLVGNEQNFDFTSQMTVSAWIKVAAFDATWQVIVTKGDSAWRLHRYADTNNIAFGTNGLTNTDLQGTTNVNDGRWHHVVGVYDGSNKYLYVDGVLDESIDATGSISTNDYPVEVGGHFQYILGNRTWDGDIDEVRVYNRALTATEAAELYRSGALLQKPPNNLGLVGYWSFNEGTSTQATDFSGNGHAGTLTGNTSWIDGKRAKALTFDGSEVPGSYVQVPDNDAFSFGDGAGNDRPFSAGGWYWVDDVTDQQGIISKQRSATGLEWICYMVATGLWVEMVDAANSNNYIGRGVSLLNAGTHQGRWMHIFFTYDGSKTSAGVKIYFDGVRVDNVNDQNGSYPGMTPTATAVQIGGYDGGRSFDGKIDEVRVYNRSLGDGEIANLYGQGTGASGAVQINASTVDLQRGSTLANGLVGHWTFDGADTGATIADRSGQNNHGYFLGGATSSAKVAGKLGQALNFDGVNDYVLSGLTGNPAAISFSAWAKLDVADTGGANILSSHPNDAITLRLDDTTGGSRGVSGYYWNGSTYIVTVTNDFLAGSGWHHIVYIADPANNRQEVYIDNVVQGSSASGNAISYVGDNALIIGAQASEGSQDFDGIIDDVRVYNRALSATEVAQLYKLGQVIIRQ